MELSSFPQPLPTELIERILSFLDHEDLDSCIFACDFLAEIIDNSSNLQYILELGVAGLQDCSTITPLSETRPELLKTLRTREHAWAQLKWRKSWKVEVGMSYRFWEVCGSVFVGGRLIGGIVPAYGVGFNAIDFYRLHDEKIEAGLEMEAGLVHLTLERVFLNYAVDPGQDLAILVDFLEVGSRKSWHLHVRSLSTLQKHPRTHEKSGIIKILVAHESWTAPNGNGFPGDTDIQIIGKTFMFSQKRGPGGSGSIAVYDWEKGTKLFITYPVLGPWASILLSSTELLIAERTSFLKQCSLSYHDFTPSKTKTKPPQHMSFELPFQASDKPWRPVLSYTQASFTLTKDSIIPPGNYPFLYPPNPMVVAFRFSQGTTRPDPSRKIDMFLLVSNLRRFKDLSSSESPNPSPIPWDSWGPNATRFFSELLPKSWQRVIRGYRVLLTHQANSYSVLDFNEGEWGEGDEGVVMESSRMALDSEGRYTVVSRAPYRRVEMRVRIVGEEGEEWKVGMMGDGIVCAQNDRNEPGYITALRVLQF